MNEKPSYRRYIGGLDLGQAAEFTALTILEETIPLEWDNPEQSRSHYAVRHLERFPIGTPYEAIAARLVTLFDKQPLAGSMLAVDQTGVGRPVIDLFREWGICAEMKFVTLTGGHSVTFPDIGYLVPKKDLVGVLQIMFQGRRLKVAPTLPDSKTLIDELLNFQMKAPTVADESKILWREGRHDDLVLAVGVAVWLAERIRPDLGDNAIGICAQPAWFLERLGVW